MRLSLPVLLLSLLFLQSCSTGIHAPVEGRQSTSAENEHIVRKGDTLFTLAWQYDLDYLDLANWNNIEEPYVIHPDQHLKLTRPAGYKKKESWVVAKKTTKSPRQTSKKTLPVQKTVKSVKKRQKKPKHSTTSSRYNDNIATSSLKWRWPTKGKIVRSFSSKKNKGIDISGKVGQAIIATTDGRVVYSGSGLIGYGKLIIIKHNKTHLSAYAHNSRIRVKEGEIVKGGQRIADMGNPVGKSALLHFEIRRSGKPVNPVRYLSKN